MGRKLKSSAQGSTPTAYKGGGAMLLSDSPKGGEQCLWGGGRAAKSFEVCNGDSLPPFLSLPLGGGVMTCLYPKREVGGHNPGAAVSNFQPRGELAPMSTDEGRGKYNLSRTILFDNF